MKIICLNLTFVCFLALNGVFEASAASDAPGCRNIDRKQVIESGKSSIQACDAALDLYNQIVDKIGATDHTKETASVISNLKAHTTEGIDLYENTPKKVSEWCAKLTPLLKPYISGQDSGKEILTKVLGDGQEIMKNGQDELHKSSLAMNAAGGDIVTLEYYLANDFNENATWIITWQNETVHTVVPKLTKKVESIREFFEDFVCTENKINRAYHDIADIEVYIEVTKTFMTIDYVPLIGIQAIASAVALDQKCNEYQQKYE